MPGADRYNASHGMARRDAGLWSLRPLAKKPDGGAGAPGVQRSEFSAEWWGAVGANRPPSNRGVKPLLRLDQDHDHDQDHDFETGMWARHASPLRIGGLENPPSVIDADRSGMNCNAVPLQSPVSQSAHWVGLGKK